MPIADKCKDGRYVRAEQEGAGMTREELQVEAKKQGYRLVKIPEYEQYLPCVCGLNGRIVYYVSNNGKLEVELTCQRCGRSVTGKSENDAKHNWNEIMRKG